MLLDQLPSRGFEGSALDFACGCGVISARLADLYPQLDISMSDVDAFALRAAKDTMRLNRKPARVLALDGLNALDRHFDLIVTNPPFHRGAHTDTGMGMQLLDSVRNFLNPRGQLLLVGNRHIPYKKWIDRIFGAHELLASSTQFQVLLAVQSDVTK